VAKNPIHDDDYLNEERAEPDAHGQAAMLLVESLIHGLVARSVLSVSEAIEIVDIATEAKLEIAEDLGGAPSPMRSSITLLTSISKSLSGDISNS